MGGVYSMAIVIAFVDLCSAPCLSDGLSGARLARLTVADQGSSQRGLPALAWSAASCARYLLPYLRAAIQFSVLYPATLHSHAPTQADSYLWPALRSRLDWPCRPFKR